MNYDKVDENTIIRIFLRILIRNIRIIIWISLIKPLYTNHSAEKGINYIIATLWKELK